MNNMNSNMNSNVNNNVNTDTKFFFLCVKMCMIELFKMNCSCMLISPCELILVQLIVNLHNMFYVI